MSRHFRSVGVVVTFVLALGAIWRVTGAEKTPAGITETLGGADRYLTYVSTDKPMYRPGETMHVRGVLLHHATRQPLAADRQLDAVIEVIGPKGDSVASGRSKSVDSALGFSWDIPGQQAGGEYTIKVSYGYEGQPPAERKFEVRSYRAPRLKSQIKFLRDGYGAGDEVVATLHAERAEGGIPADAPVTVIARVDGAEAFRGTAKVDAKGNCQARFKLPKEIKRGEGTLALVIEDGGVLETASKTIPILLQTVDLQMYPEGGDLVAGLPNRVYFEAFAPAKKPADLAGVVVDAEGKQVAEFRSEHEGRGRFSFTPAADGKYSLKITEPSGIKTTYPLPAAKPSGVVLSSKENVTSKSQEVRLTLAASKAGSYKITLRQREKELASETIKLSEGKSQELSLKAGDAEGVLIATVSDSAGKPLAERLVFRQPAKSISVKLSADQPRYVPGGNAKISVQTTDESGKPVSAVVGFNVTDESVLEMVDKREQAPRLAVMVLLEGEVRELADAHIYLDPANEQAPLAVDLLLGTQGWRRFALVDLNKFAAAHGDAARRVLAMKIATVREAEFEDRFFAAPRGGGAPPKPAAAAPEAAPVPQKAPAPVPAPVDQKPAADAEGAREEAKAERRNAKDDFAERDELREALKKQADGKAKEPFGEQAAGGLAKLQPMRDDFKIVRIYAHQVRSQRQPGQRVDFAETLFWSAGIKTDAKGQANIEFGLNDSVTSFRVAADAFASTGALGEATLAIESVQPFYLEPKLPLEVTSGDKLRIPVGIVNATTAKLDDPALKHTIRAKEFLIESGSTKFAMPANARVRQYLDLEIGKEIGQTQVVLEATAGPYADKVTRTIAVKPLGFPAQIAHGGLIATGDTVTHEIEVPKSLVPGSLTARCLVYPTPLASMNEALAALIQEPCGCFEQTSSSVYPLVMAQQYFLSHQGTDPSLVERSGQILTTGYNRLRGFESPSGGFEWFGGDPGHDALTAYGLLEFSDMNQVHHVDPVMMERTKKWLLAQRDGKGAYLRKTHTLHTWIADPECANTYNTWALLEAGVKDDLSTEVKWVRGAAEKAQNTYAIALAANVLAMAGDEEGTNHLLDTLAGKQQDDGSLKGATTSVVGSGGEALTIETTSLAVTAWLKNKRYTENVEKSIKYLAEVCKAGRYGSTQSTVLALRAIVAYDKSRAKPTSPGSLQLVVDGKEIGQPVKFDKDTSGAIELPAFAELLSVGKHQIQVKMEGGSRMPYSVAVQYHDVKPNSSEKCQVHLDVKLKDARISEGAATEAEIVVINRTGQILPTPIAIVGIPGGLEVRHDQLKELVKAKKIDAYEVLGREVVLYWRSLDTEARVDLSLSLIAAIPGDYTGPASRAYLYYTDEHKEWVDGMKVSIEAKP